MMTTHLHLRVSLGEYWIYAQLVPDVPHEVKQSACRQPRTVWDLADASYREKHKIAELAPRSP